MHIWFSEPEEGVIWAMRLPCHVQDQNVNPKAQDHVTFRTCINPRAVKAAERVGGAAAQYAGLSLHCHPLPSPGT